MTHEFQLFWKTLKGSRFPAALLVLVVMVLGALAFRVVPGEALAVMETNPGGFLWRSEPVYNPDTESYYQMVQETKVSKGGPTWAQAQERAESWQYKGRQGRLAIIDSPQLYDWIRTEFILNNKRPHKGVGYSHTWIGLRYWCSVRELIWVDGSEHPHDSYAPWNTPWHHGGFTCTTNDLTYMGVFLSGETDLWLAVGSKKRWRSYVVEYPKR